MNHLEAQLDYPLGDTLPETGKILELAPGVFWLRMSLPFAHALAGLVVVEAVFVVAVSQVFSPQISAAGLQ